MSRRLTTFMACIAALAAAPAALAQTPAAGDYEIEGARDGKSPSR